MNRIPNPWAASCPTRSSTSARIKPWAIAFWLIIWQAAAMLVGHDFLLASPLQTIACFFALAVSGAFWQAALFSLCRIFGGFLLGLIAGAVLAGLSARYEGIKQLLSPLIAVLRAIPVASFVIVALVWVPSRNLSVLVCFLIAFPVIYSGLISEIGRTDPKIIEMARLMRMPAPKKLLYVYALPALKGFDGVCATAIGLAWKSGTAAELISIPAGSIGERLYEAKVYLMTGDLFAWTILIVLLSAACAHLFSYLLRGAARWIEGV